MPAGGKHAGTTDGEENVMRARQVAAWWRRAWHWPLQPPGRTVPEAETMLLRPRPVPFPVRESSDDDTARPGLRAGPYVGRKRHGAHHKDPL